MSNALPDSSFRRWEPEDSGAPGRLDAPPELRDAQSWLRDALVGRCYVGPTISSLITEAENGDGSASDLLFSSLYSELHRMARRELARRGSPASISVTTLLHEAYLDIAAREGSHFPDKPRFMGYAARVM